jgi:hypothetical protein
MSAELDVQIAEEALGNVVPLTIDPRMAQVDCGCIGIMV